jgi:transposase
MIAADRRKAVFLLHQEGMSVGEIARRLALSRNTVREIIRRQGEMPQTVRKDKIRLDPELLARLYQECRGRVQRVHEKLEEEEGVAVKYSTLTRIVRELDLGGPHQGRCGREPDKPGAEMQHDTSPYRIPLAEKLNRLVASLLYLRYSKRRYLKFYRVFNRFAMKCFFHEALTCWGYAAAQCIIDNTNLARLRGTGRRAVIVPEMEAFARQYGFAFLCHEKGHANRKAGEERSFWTVETNFFPGRRFESLEDLNRQAFEWSTGRMDQRPQTKLRLIPAKLFEHERAYLVELPPHLPAPYLVHERGTDQYGYAALDANFYWVPGLKHENVRLIEYADRVQIYQGRDLLVQYSLPPDGVRQKWFSPPGQPLPRQQPYHLQRPAVEEEKRLRALGEPANAYLDFALKAKGVQPGRLLRELFALSGRMSSALFVQVLERALRYRITSPATLRRIALLYLTQGDPPTLPQAEIQEEFQEREAYREGSLTDAPDFSAYERLLEEENEDG